MYKKSFPRLPFGLYGPFKAAIEKLENDEPLLRIKPKFDELVQRLETKISVYYSPTEGRPSYPIKTLLGMMLIQRLYKIDSDRAIHRLCLTDALFRYFIGCESFNEPIPDDTTLVKFRKRIGEEGFREIFDELVKLASEANQISKFRIIDATHINAIGKKFGVIKFIREGINRVIKRIIKQNKEFAGRLKREFQSLKIKTKKGALKMGREFINEVSKLKEVPQKVREVIEAMELALTGEPVINYTDTEARWGYKSDDFTFGGYKAEILATEKGFITGFRVLPGNVNEGSDISPLIKAEIEKGRKPREVVGDGLYPSAKNFEYLNKQGIKGYFPNRTKASLVDKFTISGDKVICPMGEEPIGSISQENGKLYYWSTKSCKVCRLRRRCILPRESRKRVYLSDLKAMNIEERRDKLKKRSGVERVFAHAVNHRVRDSWYKGLSKTTIHLALVFTLLNLECLA